MSGGKVFDAVVMVGGVGLGVVEAGLEEGEHQVAGKAGAGFVEMELVGSCELADLVEQAHCHVLA